MGNDTCTLIMYEFKGEVCPHAFGHVVFKIYKRLPTKGKVLVMSVSSIEKRTDYCFMILLCFILLSYGPIKSVGREF